MSDVDVSKIRPGDKVKISLYGLPESDWLEVEDVDPRHSRVMATLPSGWTRWLYSGDEITAHEPAAPALPEWWGSLVVERGGYALYVPEEDAYRTVNGALWVADNDPGPVTVIVDRDGKQPAAERWGGMYKVAHAAQVRAEDRAEDYAGRYETSHASRMHAEESFRKARRERDSARADLAAFRAEVEDLRNDVYNLFDYQIEQRLTAILDGGDQ